MGELPSQDCLYQKPPWNWPSGSWSWLLRVCEELMHRGFLLTAYERRGSYRAVVIIAILFGLFHFDIMNLAGPIFLGLIIGYYVIRTGSIFAGIPLIS